jgi:copper(I)-binding protein
MKYLPLLLFTLLAFPARAANDVVNDGWVRVVPGGAPAAGYFLLRNGGGAAEYLTGASSPAFGEVMLHRTVESGGVSKMMHTDRVEVPAGGAVMFKPGGYHLMMMAPKRKLAPGERVPVTLRFADGHTVTADFDVKGPTGK